MVRSTWAGAWPASQQAAGRPCFFGGRAPAEHWAAGPRHATNAQVEHGPALGQDLGSRGDANLWPSSRHAPEPPHAVISADLFHTHTHNNPIIAHAMGQGPWAGVRPSAAGGGVPCPTAHRHGVCLCPAFPLLPLACLIISTVPRPAAPPAPRGWNWGISIIQTHGSTRATDEATPPHRAIPCGCLSPATGAQSGHPRLRVSREAGAVQSTRARLRSRRVVVLAGKVALHCPSRLMPTAGPDR